MNISPKGVMGNGSKLSLVQSAHQGRINDVKKLLKNGADVNAKEECGRIDR